MMWRIHPGGFMDKLSWIKDLVRSEQKIEEAGEVDFLAGFDADIELKRATYDFMQDLKAAFIESASAFNQLKGSSLGSIKIYGVSKTEADFMLFRNGHKLIFCVKEPGLVVVSTYAMNNQLTPAGVAAGARPANEDQLKAFWGPFGELQWTYRDQPLKIDYLVRYYVTRFARDSIK